MDEQAGRHLGRAEYNERRRSGTQARRLDPERRRVFIAAAGDHWLMHLGQWSVIRRQLGRKPLFHGARGECKRAMLRRVAHFSPIVFSGRKI